MSLAVQNKKWDVVIVGAGVGGLMTAALLSKYLHKKVLVLERHSKIGGCTHTFARRKDYIFDIGVHYISGLADDSPVRKALDRLTNNRLQWKQLPKTEKVFFEGETYVIPSEWPEFCKYLGELFPGEERDLYRYAKLVDQTAKNFTHWLMSETYPWPLDWVVRLYLRVFARPMFKTVDQVLQGFFKSAKLRRLVTYLTETTGLPTSMGSFGIHCSAAASNAIGAWFPKGGGERIAEELSRVVEDFGGEILVGTDVDEILVEDGTAKGVRFSTATQTDQKIYSDRVVSSAGAHVTYARFLRDQPGLGYDRIGKKPKDYYSYMMISVGLKQPPETLGIDSSNHWIFTDHKNGPHKTDDPDLKSIKVIYVCSPSLKRDSSAHTLEIISIVPIENFEPWIDSEWRRRPQEYKDLKKKIYDHVMEIVESHFFGVKEAVMFAEVSTPLSVEHFITGKNGALWIPATPNRFFSKWNRITTPIQNLYLAGGDVFASGVHGAILGAIKTFHWISKEEAKTTKSRGQPLPVAAESAAKSAHFPRPDQQQSP